MVLVAEGDVAVALAVPAPMLLAGVVAVAEPMDCVLAVLELAELAGAAFTSVELVLLGVVEASALGCVVSVAVGAVAAGAVAAGAALVLALDDGFCPEAVVEDGSFDGVIGVIEELELGATGWLEVEALEFEAALLQLSEIIFTLSTFRVLTSVLSGAPDTWIVCPT